MNAYRIYIWSSCLLYVLVVYGSIPISVARHLAPQAEGEWSVLEEVNVNSCRYFC